MRLLLDSSIWPHTAEALRASGHDVVWAGVWLRDPGDRVILEAAHREVSDVLVERYKVLGELAVRYGLPRSGIMRRVETLVTDVVHQSNVFVRPGIRSRGRRDVR